MRHALLLLLASSAFAQDAPPPSGPGRPAPPLEVVGFQARDDSACDPTEARTGECVDVVDFFPLDRAFEKRALDADQRAVLRDVGRLYAHAFEDLAYRWPAGDLTQTLRLDGYKALPLPSDAWAESKARSASYSLPKQAAYAGPGDWFVPLDDPSAPRVDGVRFPHVRYLGPEGQLPFPATTLLSGRFAQKLGFGGRRHDYDVMDADPGSAGPFFEEMFPYSYTQGRLSEEDTVYSARERVPLYAFQFTSDLADGGPPEDPMRAALWESLHTDGSLRGAQAAAAAHFDEFVRLLFVQTSQFAMEGYTTNQIRVLAALSALATPPGALAGQTGLARDLVAAARGETDTTAELLDRLEDADIPILPTTINLRYEVLPREVVLPWALRLEGITNDRDGFYDALNAAIDHRLAALLRLEAPPITTLDPDTRRVWLRDAVLPGEDRDEVDTEVLRLAVEVLVADMSAARRARIESWMLATQVRYAIAATFDDARIATPTEVAQAAADQWTAVVGQHGYEVSHLPQGLGAIDPLAVCTNLEGVKALDEPSFRAIHVDQLVAAPRDLQGMAVLEAAAADLPFAFLDDPRETPEVTPLFDLGDGRRLYRVRWTVWSGWHMMWGLGAATEGSAPRLALRTTAMCDDMVFADTDLVPTLVRAGLLYANFRPTTPEDPREVKREKKKVEMSSDDAVEALASGPEQAAEAMAKAEELKAMVEAPPIEDLATGGGPKFAGETFEIVQEDLEPTTTYIRDIVHRPLDRRAGDHGLMVFTFDATAPSEKMALRDLKPRTPYTRFQERVRRREADQRLEKDERYVRTAGWVWYFQPKLRDRPVQISPAYTQTDSVTAGKALPRWKRRSRVDAAFGFGVGAFPLHQVDWACDGTSTFNFSADCDAPTPLRSEGLSGDLQVMATWWAHDQPRFGLDAGAEARLDVRAAGYSLFYGPDPTITTIADPVARPAFPWSLRFQGGLILGFRHAPYANPLHRDRVGAKLWGPTQGGGRTNLTRMQWGLRTGLLLGPSYQGAEATTQLELWLAWSTRRQRGKNVSFSPYHPMFLIGPFARASYGFGLGEQTADPARYLVVQGSWTVYVGLRGYLRLQKPAKLPEAP